MPSARRRWRSRRRERVWNERDDRRGVDIVVVNSFLVGLTRVLIGRLDGLESRRRRSPES